MFPFDLVPVEEALNKKLMEDFKGERYGFIQVGPKKWMLPESYAKHAEQFYSYELKPDDIWLVTFPRSGTTLCQELIWLLNNNLDYKTSAEVPMEKRFPFFEYTILHTERLHEEIIQMNNNDPAVNEQLKFWRKPIYEWEEFKSPRHIKTHLPISLLPPNIAEKCKIIYVARNPKDVAVSYYHHNRLLRVHDYKGDFPKYWDYFSKDLVVFAPYWEHLREGWALRENKNVLFLFYEDLNKNMAESIKILANFIGKEISDSDICKLCDHLKIDNFRKSVPLRKNINVVGTRNVGEQDFLRKGQVGSNGEFTPELNKAADNWIKQNLEKTDLRFPLNI